MTATVSTDDAANLASQEQSPIFMKKRARQKVESPIPSDITSTTAVQEFPKTPLSNEIYTLPKCMLPPLSELEPIETFVMNAVRSMHQENPEPAHVQGYRAIIDTLKRPTDTSMIRNVLISLRTAGNGVVLSSIASEPVKHAQLIHVIFRFNSIRPPRVKGPPGVAEDEKTREEETIKIYKEMHVMDAHLHLMLALVSAKPTHAISIMKNVWKMLCYFPRDIEEGMSQRIHAFLCTVMRIIPKARVDFPSIVGQTFPHIKFPVNNLKHYAIHSFKVLEYLPSMRKQLVETIIDKCLEIDVNIKIKDNGEVSIEEEEMEKESTGDENGNSLAQTQASDPQMEITNENETSEIKKEDVVDEWSEKLDTLLALLFEQIRNASSDKISAREIYYELIPVFESTILTTHKSKYVQFCMFYCCGLEGNLIEGTSALPEDQEHAILHRDFASKLLGIIVDPYRATLTRQSGACYLASFMSRASYIGPDTICESISALLRWAEAYIESVGRYSIRAADSREQGELHSLFYTICQAAFYIMCFRGTEAINFYKNALEAHERLKGAEESEFPDPEHIDLSAKRWASICCHDLQPLRFCLESVRSEFLHIAHAFDLIEEDALDRLVNDAKRLSTGRVNKRVASRISTIATLSLQRQKGGVGGLGRGSNPLKSFFPFDPLLLYRSHEAIEPFYRHWQGPVEEEDALSIDDGSEDEAEEEDEGVFEMDESDNEDVDDANDDDNILPAIVSDPDMKNGNTTDAEDENFMDEEDEDRFHTPDINETKRLQRKAWSEVTKRPRSQSMENGSW